MRLESLTPGFRTEMMFHRFDGMVVERDDYVLVKTPSNPGYMFGNFLLFFEAPKLGSLEKWKATFRREFEDMPDVRHFTFSWNSPLGDLGDVTEFGMEGFKIDFSVSLTARTVHSPAKTNSQVEVRALKTDAEWRQVIESQILAKGGDFEAESYRRFKETQFARFRKMSEQGVGFWFGAFLGDKIIGDLGIYQDGPIGRFQSVETHPRHRRQGVCGRLVYETSRFAFEKMGVSELVMVADENYHAAKIYESVGFAPVAKEHSAYWWKR